MHDAIVAGADFDGFDPARVRERQTEDEIPVRIGAARRQQKRFRGLQSDIRFAELPAGGKFRRRRQIFGVTLRFAGFVPRAEHGDLFGRQTKFVGEGEVGLFRQPRRHVAAPRDGYDLARVGADVVVGEQRKRPSFAGAVTGRAKVKHHRRDIAVEGYVGCVRSLLRRPTRRRGNARTSGVGRNANHGQRGDGRQREREKIAELSSDKWAPDKRAPERQAHDRSDRKQPTAGTLGNVAGWPLTAATIASASSCVVGSGRARPKSSNRLSMRP